MQQHSAWCAEVEQRVREEIRSLRLDPMHDGSQVSSLIERISTEVVIGSVGNDGMSPSLGADVASVGTSVQHAICGFGPLQPFFDDDSIEEIWINDPGRVFIARSGVSELTPVVLTSPQVRDLVERMLRWSGRRLDLSQPFVDATLPDGSRLHVVIPDFTREHWAVNIRRFVVRPRSVHDLVPTGTLTALDHVRRAQQGTPIPGLEIVSISGTGRDLSAVLQAPIRTAFWPIEATITVESVAQLDYVG